MGVDSVYRGRMGAISQELISAVDGNIGVAVAAERRIHAALSIGRAQVRIQYHRADVGGLAIPVPFVGNPAVRSRIGGGARAERRAGQIEQCESVGVVEAALNVEMAIVPGVERRSDRIADE